MAAWKKALDLDPSDARANNGIGSAFFALGDIYASVTYYRKAIQINPNFFEAYFNLGLSEIKNGDLDSAIDDWSNVVRMRPNYAAGHENLAYAYYLKGKFTDCLEQLQQSLDADQNQPSVLNLAAILMSTCPDSSIRNGPQALKMAQQADQLTRHANPIIVDTLSAAFAEQGQFGTATENEQQAIALAQRQGNPELVKTLEAHLARYAERQPLREPPDPVAFWY